MATETELRKASTEAFFRDVNERIAETASDFGSEAAQFVCECGEATCTERVEATLEEYEDARADGTHFLLRPGHEDDSIERVVEQRRGYAVVEKFKAAVARRVRQLDPRAELA